MGKSQATANRHHRQEEGKAFRGREELLTDLITTEDGAAKGLLKMSLGEITMEP
jgi:hypothetical protein